MVEKALKVKFNSYSVSVKVLLVHWNDAIYVDISGSKTKTNQEPNSLLRTDQALFSAVPKIDLFVLRCTLLSKRFPNCEVSNFLSSNLKITYLKIVYIFVVSAKI